MSEAAASGHALQLAVVVPTYNERANVRPFLEGLKRALSGIAYEVIFVDDDSPDSTADEIRAIGILDPGVRVIQRIQRRGLASACIEGMMATSAPVIAVMDNLDLVVATRKAEGGSMGGFGRSRLFLSNLGSRLSQSIIGCHISDPMSGFFLVRREYIHEVVRSASGVGFKILLDLVASAKRPIAVGEVPYTFRERLHGTSKLDLLVGIEYLELLLDKKIGRLVPVRFILFSMVGAAGVLASTIVLYTSVKFFHTGFFSGQIIATLVSMTGNFLLNNSMTYRDRRLKGRQLVSGLITFYLACSVGAVINVRIAELALSLGSPWLIAGAIGLGVGAVWNYGMTSFFTWRLEQRQR